MKPIYLWIALVAFLASAVGNAMLYARVSADESRIASINQELSDNQAELAKSNQDLKSKSDAVNTLHTAVAQLQSQLSHARCTNPIQSSAVSSLSTNQGLIEPITKAVEQSYGLQSVSTTFRVVWNNSKTAVFEIIQSDRTSVQVAATWSFDSGKLVAIYNLGEGCLYYLP